LTQRYFSGHPNVVLLFGFTVNEFPRLAVGIQELVWGGRLFDYVTKKPFSMPVSRVLIFQTVTAIEYIHSRKFVHRDLKTENLLVDGTLDIAYSASWVKITDFGMTVPFC
jgi:serine/threonine protein kinase